MYVVCVLRHKSSIQGQKDPALFAFEFKEIEKPRGAAHDETLRTRYPTHPHAHAGPVNTTTLAGAKRYLVRAKRMWWSPAGQESWGKGRGSPI